MLGYIQVVSTVLHTTTVYIGIELFTNKPIINKITKVKVVLLNILQGIFIVYFTYIFIYLAA